MYIWEREASHRGEEQENLAWERDLMVGSGLSRVCSNLRETSYEKVSGEESVCVDRTVPFPVESWKQICKMLGLNVAKKSIQAGAVECRKNGPIGARLGPRDPHTA